MSTSAQKAKNRLMPHIQLRYTFISGFLLKLIEKSSTMTQSEDDEEEQFLEGTMMRRKATTILTCEDTATGMGSEGPVRISKRLRACDLCGDKYCRACSPSGRPTHKLFHNGGARCQLHLESVRVGLFKSVNTYFEKAINISQGGRVTLPPLL